MLVFQFSAHADETSSASEEVAALEARITAIEQSLEKQTIALLTPGNSQSKLLEFTQYIGKQLLQADEAISATAIEKRLKDQAEKLKQNGRISAEARKPITAQLALISAKAQEAGKKALVTRYNLKQLDKACAGWIIDVNEISKLDETAAQEHLAERMNSDVTRILGKLPVVPKAPPPQPQTTAQTSATWKNAQKTTSVPAIIKQQEKPSSAAELLPAPDLLLPEPQTSSSADTATPKAVELDESGSGTDQILPGHGETEGENPPIRLGVIVAEYEGWPQVQEVNPGLGSQMGIRPDDLIIEVNGTKTNPLRLLDHALSQARDKRQLDIIVLRRGGGRYRLSAVIP
jgi:hypothetical protein